MVRCKNAGGGPGDDERRPPSSGRDKGKGQMQDPAKKKKHKRLDRDTQMAIAIVEAAGCAKRGGRGGSLRIEDPDPARVDRAIQMIAADAP